MTPRHVGFTYLILPELSAIFQLYGSCIKNVFVCLFLLPSHSDFYSFFEQIIITSFIMISLIQFIVQTHSFHGKTSSGNLGFIFSSYVDMYVICAPFCIEIELLL